jgi:hypothetical protein
MDSAPAPDQGPEYGSRVWRRIEGNLTAHRRGWWKWASLPKLNYAMACAAMAALLVVSFLAGRYYPHRPAAPVFTAEAGNGERILLVAVGDYLERSQMVLIELANANSKVPLDISLEQQRAQELISETRLYRQTASAMEETAVSGILDELERLLLDIAHAPSRLSPAELEAFRGRLNAANILFKIRVVNSNVRSQEETPRQTL